MVTADTTEGFDASLFRDWLASNVPKEPRPAEDSDKLRAYDTAWQAELVRGGWAAPFWPREHGGMGLSPLGQLAWYETYVSAGAPPVGVNFAGLHQAGPVLIEHGTEGQRAHLPRILAGTEVWCQGFSEPEAGSDLASLRTRAVRDGDSLVISGRKIWTSYARHADLIELLVRTGAPDSRSRGLSWVICEMDRDGVDVRPITTIMGSNHFFEITLDEVRVPLTHVVGEIDGGWSVARATLQYERGGGFVAPQLTLLRAIDDLKAIEPSRRRSDADLRAGLAVVAAEGAGLRSLTLSAIAQAERHEPDTLSSVVRLYFAELSHRVHDLAIDIVGAGSIERGDNGLDRWALGYLNSFRNVIAAGTSDIQRNIIGEQLGLPR